MAAAYNLDDLIAACGKNPPVVVILKKAKASATGDFGLLTEKAARDFIHAGGLEKPRHLNTRPWKNNPKPQNAILVDAYDFYSGPCYGYLAFFFNSQTGKWIVKSFKKNEQPDQRNFALAEKLRSLMSPRRITLRAEGEP